MKYQHYSAYRPSPISWLDQMPQHWSAAALRWRSRRYAGGTPDKGNEAYWEDGDIPWLNSGAVNDRYITEPSALITREGFANSSAKWIPKEALVMALAGQGKTKGMVAQLGIETTCNQSMAAIIPDRRFVPRYLYWWLTANYQNIRNLAGGEARDGLNLDLLGSIQCPVPPMPEQEAIACFLDAHTGRIDTLVAKKRQLIDKLKEKRSALIARTVTRGLPPCAAKAAGLVPNPAMKDSGEDWIGKMPSHWKAKKGSYLGRLIGSVAPAEEDITDDEDEVPYAKVDDLNYLDSSLRLISTKVRVSCAPPRWKTIILFPKRGAAIFTNKVALATGVIFDSNLMGWEINQDSDSKFVAYCLIARRLDDLADVSTVPQINNKHIYPAKFPHPPRHEQEIIAAYLDRETSRIDQLTAKVETAIARLTEYRQALITSAVTGKIDVREAIA